MVRALQGISIFVCVLCLTGGAYGGFLLQLHNGGEIVVNDYRRVEGEIRYSRYGGIVGVPASEVKDIRPTTRKPVEVTSPSSRTSESHAVSSQPGEPVEMPAGTDTPMPATAEDLRYMGEFESLKRRFGNLASMNGPDMLAFAEEITAFRDKVLKSQVGHIYSPQLLELYEMVERIEAVYKERYQ
jgi:hypothetical protein